MSANFITRIGWVCVASCRTHGFLIRKSLPATTQLGRWNSSVFHFRRSNHSDSKSATNRVSADRIEKYVEPEVQSLLKALTGRDYQKIFRSRKLGQKLRSPKYSFMTERQLNETLKDMEETADKLLQMPPVLRPRNPIDKILSFDPELQGLDTSTLIFTDISLNTTDRDRIIVARDPDGTLRQATCEERDKLNQIYFPKIGKEYKVPRMFSDPELLKACLDRANDNDNSYLYMLDRACLQFEPDDPLYINVVETTYNHLNEKRNFDLLKSTRHFGPCVFYLVRNRKMDDLLLHSIKKNRVSNDCVALVSLFHILFPECKSKEKTTAQKFSDLEKVRCYIELDAIKRSELELALNAYEENLQNLDNLEEDLKRSHGG